MARTNLITALSAAVIVLLPHVAVWGLQRAEGAAAAVRLELPAQLAPGWAAAGAGPWTPAYLNPSSAAAQTYTGPGGTVGVYIAYYRGQGYDRKLVSGLNTLVGLNDRNWELRGGASQEVSGGGQTITVKTAEVAATRAQGADRPPHLVVWRVYWVDGRFIAGDAQAKVAGALARLRGRGDEGAALVVHADAGTVEASNAALQSFMQDNLSALGALLQQTRDTR